MIGSPTFVANRNSRDIGVGSRSHIICESNPKLRILLHIAIRLIPFPTTQLSRAIQSSKHGRNFAPTDYIYHMYHNYRPYVRK